MTEAVRRPPRIPLNFFGIPFGIAGLAGTWLTFADQGKTPVAAGDVLLAVSAVVWLALLTAYARHASSDRRGVVDDLMDPIASPFASLVVITPMLWAAEGLYPRSATTGRVIVDVFVALAVVLGCWFTGQWIYAPLDLDTVHPGYFLPTVAGGLVAAFGAAEVGQQQLAVVMFGYGAISWLLVGSLILGRLFFRPLPPPALLPTLAIEVAPAAVASIALFALNGDTIGTLAELLAGYGVLMVIAQLRLMPAFIRLPFMPSTWAFTFSWAAVATAVLHWLYSDRPSGYVAYEYIVLTAITVLVGGIMLRTLIALAHAEFLPSPVEIRTNST